ncbi:MAG: GTP-dependent dephospho-CoA kinase family protein [Methanobacteriota archaeon]
MFALPEALRPELAKPWGPVLSAREAAAEAARHDFVIAVGDLTTQRFLAAGVDPRVAVVDYKTQRTESMEGLKTLLKKSSERQVLSARNPPARITGELWNAIARAVASPARTLIEVEGEEDLAVLPAILLAPLGAIVAYGQPNQGIVLVTVDEARRSKVKSILKRMEES